MLGREGRRGPSRKGSAFPPLDPTMFVGGRRSRETNGAPFPEQHGGIGSCGEQNIAPRRRLCGPVAVVLVKAGAAPALAIWPYRRNDKNLLFLNVK